MLENIKLVLGITDASQDSLINYYINAVSNKILAYCNISGLPDELKNVVEEIVIGRMQKSAIKNVKSEEIGDYKVEYAIYESDKNELDPYIKILNKFRKVRFV